MAIVKNGEVISDSWLRVGDQDGLTSGAAVVVPLTRWREARDSLIARNGPLAVILASNESAKEIAGDLDHFQAVFLDFPKFGDGRAFSSARLLRERYGFRGEIRAVGQVLEDQLLFMHRCGFDAFEIARENPLEIWQRAVGAFSVWYQPAADQRASVMQRRMQSVTASGNWAY